MAHVTFEWTGAASNSESAKKIDDVEVTRNLYRDTNMRTTASSNGDIERVENGIIVTGGTTNTLMPPTTYSRTEDADGRLFSASFQVTNLSTVASQSRIRIYHGSEYHSAQPYVTIQPEETVILKAEGTEPRGTYSQPRIQSINPGDPSDNILHISRPIWEWSETISDYFDGDSHDHYTASTHVYHNGMWRQLPAYIYDGSSWAEFEPIVWA